LSDGPAMRRKPRFPLKVSQPETVARVTLIASTMCYTGLLAERAPSSGTVVEG
jgi:hypothetical protein